MANLTGRAAWTTVAYASASPMTLGSLRAMLDQDDIRAAPDTAIVALDQGPKESAMRFTWEVARLELTD